MIAARRAVLAAAAAVVLGAAPQAVAHTRSVSYSSWELDGGGARVTLRTSVLELTRLRPDPGGTGPLDRPLAEYLTSRLALRAEGRACGVSDGPRRLAAPAGEVAFEWRVDCAGAEPDEVASRLLLDVAPGHLHFARLLRPGEPPVLRVLSGAETTWPIAGSPEPRAPPASGSSLAAYLALGVEHIATGADHLVFVLALLLLASRLAEVATIVTGFTIAHSLTLGLAVLGGWRPESHAIEALIGLSIALVASENAWLLSGRHRAVPLAVGAALAGMTALAAAGVGALPAATPAGLCLFALCYFEVLARSRRPVRLRVAIAFVFGLVHGFGFAGVLEEVALPKGRLATALLGFNLGVEAGQLAIVAVSWPLLRALAGIRAGALQRPLIEAGTAVVCALGVFWLVERAYF